MENSMEVPQKTKNREPYDSVIPLLGKYSDKTLIWKDISTPLSNTLTTWCKELTHLKIPWCWERLKAGGEEDDRGWDVWMAITDSMDMSLSKRLGIGDGRGSWCAAVHDIAELDMTEWLNWTEWWKQFLKSKASQISFAISMGLIRWFYCKICIS